MFCPLPLVEVPRWAFSLGTAERGHEKHVPQTPVVSPGPVQHSRAGTGIVRHGREPGIGSEFGSGAERCEIASSDGQEFSSQSGTDAGDTFDDVRLMVAAEAFGDLFVEGFDLMIEAEELLGEAGDELFGRRFRLHGNGLPLCYGDGLGDHPRDGGATDTGGAQVRAEFVGSCIADRGRCAVAGEQGQSGAGGVVERAFQFREYPQQQRPESINAGDPLPHQVRPVAGQQAALGDDVVRCRDGGQVPRKAPVIRLTTRPGM